MDHVNSAGVLLPQQHGFRAKLSCETQLLEFTNDIATNLNRGLQSDVCVLDFSKAFDKVGHQRLLHKLRWYGISGKTNNWIASFLSSRQQTVVVDGKSSEPLPVLSGVPQGSVLGPCLFLLYINDIAEDLHSKIRLFADDTMIYLTIKNTPDAHHLQEDLDKLAAWEATWMMQFHPGKCEIISISKKSHPIVYNYTLHGQTLRHVDVVKYLGVNISKDLRWEHHIDYVAAKAMKPLNFLRRNLKIGNTTVKSNAYKSIVRPILEYGQTVWDPYTATMTSRLEMVQRRAARFVTGQHAKTASVTDMLKKLEWETLETRRRNARLVMFYKIHYSHVSIKMPLKPKKRKTPSRHENTLAYEIPPSKIDIHKFSFFPRTSREWNTMKEETVNIQSLESFKVTVSH